MKIQKQKQKQLHFPSWVMSFLAALSLAAQTLAEQSAPHDSDAAALPASACSESLSQWQMTESRGSAALQARIAA